MRHSAMGMVRIKRASKACSGPAACCAAREGRDVYACRRASPGSAVHRATSRTCRPNLGARCEHSASTVRPRARQRPPRGARDRCPDGRRHGCRGDLRPGPYGGARPKHPSTDPELYRDPAPTCSTAPAADAVPGRLESTFYVRQRQPEQFIESLLVHRRTPGAVVGANFAFGAKVRAALRPCGCGVCVSRPWAWRSTVTQVRRPTSAAPVMRRGWVPKGAADVTVVALVVEGGRRLTKSVI